MTVSWVLGRRGLLGSALERELLLRGGQLHVPAEPFDWGHPDRLVAQVRAAADAFLARAADAGGWEIYWAAGIGTMGSREEMLTTETTALGALLDALAGDPRAAAVPGLFGLSSSAGAIWAGSSEDVITERSELAPTTPYARAKLEQEARVQRFAQAMPSVRVLVARISTLYGIADPSARPKGLLAHIARCVVRRQPVQIFVPYDTIRDYIFADDAALVMIETQRALPPSAPPLMRIVASERPTTIAEILSEFKKISRHPPRVVRAATQLSGLYARCTRFESTVPPAIGALPMTGLPVGLARLMGAERGVFARDGGRT